MMWVKEMLWRGCVYAVGAFLRVLEYFGYDPDHERPGF